MTAELLTLPARRTDNTACIELLEETLELARAGKLEWVLIAHGDEHHWHNKRSGLDHPLAMGYLHRWMHKLQQQWDDVS